LNLAQVWEPFIMRTAVPNLDRGRVKTDGWSMRRTTGPGDREMSIDSLDADEPVDLVFGGSFCFGVGHRMTAPQRPRRAALNLGGFSHSLAQNLIAFMFLCGHFTTVRNVVIAVLNEIYLLQACDAIYRRFGLFQFNERFLNDMNGGLNQERRGTPLGDSPRPFARLTHREADEDAERALLNESLQGVFSTWTCQAAVSGARLVAVTQSTPDLQQRKLAEGERELFDRFDAASGIMEADSRVVRCHSAWHRQDMEDLSGRIRFDYLEINDRIGNDYDQAWLYVDRVHMSDMGYALAAEIVAETLQR
tara:strand:- start:1537 stop:2454 length:918 start_codon:yes stop_codon:yes gene_type:complete